MQLVDKTVRFVLVITINNWLNLMYMDNKIKITDMIIVQEGCEHVEQLIEVFTWLILYCFKIINKPTNKTCKKCWLSHKYNNQIFTKQNNTSTGKIFIKQYVNSRLLQTLSILLCFLVFLSVFNSIFIKTQLQ